MSSIFNRLYNLKNGSVCALYPAEAMALTAFFCNINIVFESAPQDNIWIMYVCTCMCKHFIETI